MRQRHLASAALAASALLAACADSPTAPTNEPPADVNPSVTTGEYFTRIAITNPSTSYYSMYVGGTKQMTATLYFSQGGTLSGGSYATWMSVDPCIAKVTSASPSWGKVTGIKSGVVYIIAVRSAKADTVKVTVSGTGNLDSGCYLREWTFNLNDVSFTGTPATSYSVKSGEVLKKLVLFAPKTTVYKGTSRRLIGEMWYSGGGKLNGVPYVRFYSTNGAVATVDYRTGYLTARAIGRTKILMKLGSMVDTIPVYVK